MDSKIVLIIMKRIIDEYLKDKLSRSEAVERLINEVDTDFIHDLDVKSNPGNFFITDCYYTIKHLTETGYESTDEEIRYFSDCLNKRCIYNLDDKNEILRNYYKI